MPPHKRPMHPRYHRMFGSSDHVIRNRLTSLAELEPAPQRRGFRLTPLRAPNGGHSASPTFNIPAAKLWQIWLTVTAGEPRTKLLAQDVEHRRTAHVQRSAVFRFPDIVRAEIISIEPGASSIAIDSQARYGHYDFGVNRRRVLRWLAQVTEAVQRANA
jgi:uncharacterized protein (DUF1499 family)